MNLILKLAFAIIASFANSNPMVLNQNMPYCISSLINEKPISKSNAYDIVVIPVKTPTLIEAKPNEQIYIKDRLLKARTIKNKTYLVGQKPGLTLVKLAKREFLVRVLSAEDWDSHLSFLNLFSTHPSIKLNHSGTDPIVEGEILVETDFIDLLKWLDKRKTKVKFNLKFLNSEFKQSALHILSEKLGVSVIDVDETLDLKLARDPNKADLKNLESLNLSHSLENLNGTELGLLDIQFISLTDTEIKNAAPILPTAFQWTINEKVKLVSQVIDSEYSQLNGLNNKSSLINLMLFENEKTEYHSGGEFAIEQRSIYRNDVQWKSFGLFIEATPKSLSEAEVEIQLKIKMSYLISSDMNQPSLSQDSWTQKFRIKKNKPLVVSNSLTNMFAKNKSNHLFLKSIPILGSLFKGKNSNKENSNIYMVIKLNRTSEEEI